MIKQKIHIIGYDEVVYLMGLLGIEGTVLERPEDIMREFNNLLKNESIGILLIALDLPNQIRDFIFDYKLNNRSPIIYVLPNIFNKNIEQDDIFLNNILKTINKIIT